jgi:hypothetical protein
MWRAFACLAAGAFSAAILVAGMGALHGSIAMAAVLLIAFVAVKLENARDRA